MNNFMVNLILIPNNTTPEFIFSEYEPHFNYLVQNNRTPVYIATKHPELFYNKKFTIPSQSIKDTKKYLSNLLNIAVKYINTLSFPKYKISDDYKIYRKNFDICPNDILEIPKNSKLLDYLDKLKYAKKIVTEQEIFVHFASVYNIECLGFYSNWNPNYYKYHTNIKTLSSDIYNKRKFIDEFINT